MPKERDRVATWGLLLIFLFQGNPVIAAESKQSEVEKLRAEVERLERRAEEQRRLISAINNRIEKLEETKASIVREKSTVQEAELQRIAGRGAPAGETAEVAPASDGEVVKEARPSQSVEDILREEHSLFKRRLTIEPGVTYSYSDRRQITLSGFLALDAIFLGNISVDTVKNHITTFDLTSRYGFSDRFEVEANLPFLYRTSTFQAGGVGGAANAVSEADVDEADLGDVTASIFYRLKQETRNMPDIVANLGFRAPTGSDPFGIPTLTDPNNSNLTYPAELPTGNGVWGITGGLSFLKTIDPAIVFANVGYTYNLEESFDDISANPGAQPGDVDLGDSVRFGFGTAFALNERFSLSLSYAQQLTFESETQINGQPRQDVVGSDANVATVNVGATYALSNTKSFVSNVGIGLTNDASDVTVTFRMPFQL